MNKHRDNKSEWCPSPKFTTLGNDGRANFTSTATSTRSTHQTILKLAVGAAPFCKIATQRPTDRNLILSLHLLPAVVPFKFSCTMKNRQPILCTQRNSFLFSLSLFAPLAFLFLWMNNFSHTQPQESDFLFFCCWNILLLPQLLPEVETIFETFSTLGDIFTSITYLFSSLFFRCRLPRSTLIPAPFNVYIDETLCAWTPDVNAALSASPAQSAYVTPLRLNLFRSAMNAVGFSPPACPNSIFSVEFGVDFFFLPLSLSAGHTSSVLPRLVDVLYLSLYRQTPRVCSSLVLIRIIFTVFLFSFEIPHYWNGKKICLQCSRYSIESCRSSS